MAYQYPYDYRKADPIELVKMWVRGLSWIVLAFGLLADGSNTSKVDS
jgi:hypothetical protein